MSPPFHVVLVEPLIPQNTGNVGRLCVATGARLHLVRPLGFDISDKAVRRAGLDYWKNVDLVVHDDTEALGRAVDLDRAWLFSARATRSYSSATFQPGDVLVFGKETTGLGELGTVRPDRLLTVPFTGPVRSLNLSTTVGIVVYEGLRQTRPDLMPPAVC